MCVPVCTHALRARAHVCVHMCVCVYIRHCHTGNNYAIPLVLYIWSLHNNCVSVICVVIVVEVFTVLFLSLYSQRSSY